MKRYFERRRIARALELLERERRETLDPASQRQVDAHRRIADMLRLSAPSARITSAGSLRERVLAAIEANGPTALERRALERASVTMRRVAIAAAALVVGGAGAWLALRPKASERAPIARHSLSELAPKLSALGALPRSSTAKLRQALDQPLLGEVDKLAQDTRSLGRFLRGRLPAFVLRADDDRPWH